MPLAGLVYLFLCLQKNTQTLIAFTLQCFKIALQVPFISPLCQWHQNVFSWYLCLWHVSAWMNCLPTVQVFLMIFWINNICLLTLLGCLSRAIHTWHCRWLWWTTSWTEMTRRILWKALCNDKFRTLRVTFFIEQGWGWGFMEALELKDNTHYFRDLRGCVGGP